MAMPIDVCVLLWCRIFWNMLLTFQWWIRSHDIQSTFIFVVIRHETATAHNRCVLGCYAISSTNFNVSHRKQYTSGSIDVKMSAINGFLFVFSRQTLSLRKLNRVLIKAQSLLHIISLLISHLTRICSVDGLCLIAELLTREILNKCHTQF